MENIPEYSAGNGSKKPLRLEFKIPRIDKHGKPLKNQTGEDVFDIYIYDFEEMGMNRKLMARMFFMLSSKILSNMPKDPEHVAIIADRQLELKGFSAILMKKLDEGGFEDYDPAKTELSEYAQNQIGKSKDDWDKLIEAQEDFFLKVRLQLPGLMMQSNDIMMQSLGIIGELQKVAGAAGIQEFSEMKGLMELVLNAATSCS